MSANACFSMRNKIKPKKRKNEKEMKRQSRKKRKKKKRTGTTFLCRPLLPLFKNNNSRLRREETGFYSSYAGSTTKWRQKFRSNILYACLQIFPSFDRILSMFVDFSTFRSLVDFFMLRRIECFQEKAIF